MKQPELGILIAKIREEKGLTQEELVSRCNISVRTLQRIESGKVTPRSYSLKSIAAVLDCDLFTGSDVSESGNFDSPRNLLFQQIREYIIDLFNLKTGKMRKISILSVTFFVLVFSMYTVGSMCFTQQTKCELEYVRDNSRGFEILIPRNLEGYGSYISSDTLHVRAGKDIIKEYNGTLLLNNIPIGKVSKGDTVIYKKGNWISKNTLIIKPYIPKYTISNRILFDMMYNIDRVLSDENGDTFIVNQYKIREKDNRIYLNDTYVGDAFANDTVILRKGEITIKHAVNNVGLQQNKIDN